MYKKDAIDVLKSAISPIGFLASANKIDNYARVWSRDAMMTGITSIYIKNEELISALENSIQTLMKNQANNGQIPSNVSEDSVSFGSLVGRTDATTWWIVGTTEFLLYKNDPNLVDVYREAITKALECLQCWEYNQKGLLYSPLGGNWADEYVTSGYTLYDNVLYYWALKNAAKVLKNKDIIIKSEETKRIIQDNFFKPKQENNKVKYHSTAFEKAPHLPYFFATLNANGYDDRFDMAGNALALILGFSLDISAFSDFLESLQNTYNHWLLPVFHPVIHPTDKDWSLLVNNYSYHFKNEPFHFHNGGAWPIFLGWLCLALKKQDKKEIAQKILEKYQYELGKNNDSFHEYYSTDQLSPCGTESLCFSAAGYLLMTLE